MEKEKSKKSKENPARSYKGFATVTAKINELIEVNPDIKAEELNLTVKPIIQEYEFDRSQSDFFAKFARQYESKHNIIKKYRELYPSDEGLFVACFGRKPRGKVEIIDGPITFHVRCYDIDDFVLAYSVHKTKGDEHKIDPEDRKWMQGVVASALYEVLILDLRDSISIENFTRLQALVREQNPVTATLETLKQKNQKMSERGRLHEEQHQINRILKPTDKRKGKVEILEDFKKQGDIYTSAAGKLIEGLVYVERRFMEEKVWDETIALYRGGRKRAKDLYREFIKHAVYDYPKRYKERIAGISRQVQYDIKEGLNIDVSRDDIQIYIDKIFGEQYRSDLEQWLNAIAILEGKGYSSDKVMLFLYQEPVYNWPILAAVL